MEYSSINHRNDDARSKIYYFNLDVSAKENIVELITGNSAHIFIGMICMLIK